MGEQPHRHGWPAESESFYHLADVAIDRQRCQGTACFVARRRDPEGWADAERAEPRVYCLGRCYAAPAAADDTSRPTAEIACDTSVVIGRLARGASRALDAYQNDGYAGLARALEIRPEATLGEVEASGRAAGAAPSFPPTASGGPPTPSRRGRGWSW